MVKKWKPRNQHKVTEKTKAAVLECVTYGMPQAQICKFIGISEPTLRKHYRHELDVGETAMLLQVSKNVHDIALDKADTRSLTAGIFLLKTRAGFRETNRTELTGKDGAPLEITASAKATLDPRSMSPETRDELKRLLQERMAEVEHHPDGEEMEYEEYDDEDEAEGELVEASPDE
jgi:hypothetical protein